MDLLAWLLIAVALILIIFIVVVIFSKKQKKCPPDYKSWFVMGIMWIIIGLPFGILNKNFGLLGIGIVFTILGLSHKKEWQKNKKSPWHKLSRKQKIIKIIALVASFLAAVAIGIYFVLRF